MKDYCNKSNCSNPCSNPCSSNLYGLYNQNLPTQSIQGPPGIGIRGPPGIGIKGSQGLTGTQGPIGLTGTQGLIGPIGLTGTQGPIGLTGTQGLIGLTGTQGPIGLTGETGTQGLTGPIGSIELKGFVYADFFALMPDDNSLTIAPGSSVSFPQNGPSNGIISRINGDQFNLPNIGIYEVNFQVSITEPGQLVIVLNSVEDSTSVVGRATGTSQIIGISLIQTFFINSILSINNPVSESSALTITPVLGGTKPVSAHLIIKQIT